MFTNEQILPGSLPAVESLSLHPLEKNYLKVERISIAISSCILLLIALALFYFIDGMRQTYLEASVAALLIVIVASQWIATAVTFNVSGYALRQKDLVYRSGWIFRKTRIVPLNRVQHVSVQSGPIERLYHLASVSIYTAGAGQADFTIRGISQETASQIKQWITEQLNGRDSSL